MKVVMKIVSLEPLKESWVDSVKMQTGQDIAVILRDKVQEEAETLSSTEILICRDRDLTESLLGNLQNVKWIFIVSTGVDKLPFDYLQEREIQIVNSPNVSDEAMSDYTIGAMMLYSCKFKELLQCQQKSFWKPYAMTDPLQGKNLLIVGAGKIGQRIADKAKVFGMKILGICRQPKEINNFDVVKGVESLKGLCQEADYVVCTLPLTGETAKIFNEDVFRQMKENAVFINISRGGLVNTGDLCRCLKEKVIAGAVLDVFEKEPLSVDSELWELDNLVITPHSSGRIENYLEEAMKIFTKNLYEYIESGKLINTIDLRKGY